ncbi:MAG: gliding motility-associated protein GldE [Cytophagales bacterium]|nr:MAG: gliding motility-associated protein GldE [Cytophagales bacterium]
MTLGGVLTMSPNEMLVVLPIGFAVIAILLGASAFMSGSELGFFSLSPQQLLRCRSSSSKAERSIAALLDNPNRLLATILIMNNLVNVSIATLSNYLMLGVIDESQGQGLEVFILTMSVTALIVFFGEVMPKVAAGQNPFGVAKFAAGPMNFLSAMLFPFSWVLMQMGILVEKLIKKKGYNVSVDELQEALEMTTNSDETTYEEKEILKGIVNFGTISAKQIMRSRVDINAFDVQIKFLELLASINKSGYSRVPIYRDSLDKIEGILYIKEVLPYLDEADDFEWQKLIRKDVYFIPENKKIDDLMRDFQRKRVHMAVVADEYGGTSGLITLEDIIEEIIGDINDEFDSKDLEFDRVDNFNYTFEGRTSIYDFCRILNIDVSYFQEIKGDSESLGGLLLELFGKLPRVGEKKRFRNFVFSVVAMDKKRIKTVKITLKEAKTDKETDV